MLILLLNFCLAFLLAHVKQIVQADTTFRQGKWESRHYKKLTLRKKNILILGAGAIAIEFARLLNLFTTNVVGLTRSKKDAPYIKKMVTWDEYEKEAGEADFIINILPVTAVTKRILDDKKNTTNEERISFYECRKR